MGLVDFSCRMKSAAAVSVGAARKLDGELTIRLSPISPPGSIPGIPRSSTWAWAVVLETRGASVPDALLAGGHADSQTAAVAQATEELKKQERVRAHVLR